MKTSEYIYMAGLRGYCITLGRALQYEISHLVQPMLVSCLSLNSNLQPHQRGEAEKLPKGAEESGGDLRRGLVAVVLWVEGLSWTW